MSNLDYQVCATTSALNLREDNQDTLNYQFNDTYNQMVAIFKDDIDNATCIEDIADDLVFEIEMHVNRYSYSIDKDEVASEIYKEFNLKDAK